MHIDQQLLTLVFAAVAGVGVLLQTLVLLGMLFALRETQKKLHSLSERLEDAVFPVVYTSRRILEDLAPKVKVISSNVLEASETLRKQAENVSQVVGDVSSRTRRQTARVDGMITGTLDSIGEATAAIERGIAAPLRQVNGVLAGIRAGLESLRGNEASRSRKATTKARTVAVDDFSAEEAAEAEGFFVHEPSASEIR